MAGPDARLSCRPGAAPLRAGSSPTGAGPRPSRRCDASTATPGARRTGRDSPPGHALRPQGRPAGPKARRRRRAQACPGTPAGRSPRRARRTRRRAAVRRYRLRLFRSGGPPVLVRLDREGLFGHAGRVAGHARVSAPLRMPLDGGPRGLTSSPGRPSVPGEDVLAAARTVNCRAYLSGHRPPFATRRVTAANGPGRRLCPHVPSGTGHARRTPVPGRPPSRLGPTRDGAAGTTRLHHCARPGASGWPAGPGLPASPARSTGTAGSTPTRPCRRPRKGGVPLTGRRSAALLSRAGGRLCPGGWTGAAATTTPTGT